MRFKLQFKTLLKKNFLLGWRTKEIVVELLMPFIAAILLSLKSN
jgi:hypothetical protein